MDGISSIQQDLSNKERAQVITRLFGSIDQLPVSKETKELKRKRIEEKLVFKVQKAMRMSPLQRDLKIMRNGLKFFFKDLFC